MTKVEDSEGSGKHEEVSITLATMSSHEGFRFKQKLKAFGQHTDCMFKERNRKEQRNK